ncbi:MAG TPA: tRNA pseudouridine(55) synthase TruB [Acidobacteriaceae bacterium]
MNGLIVIDKQGGMTSHDVVSRMRRITGEQSIGHLGTLDPMATGVLPLLLGKFTRLAQFFSMAEKSYTGHIRFGFATDTYDAEGERVGSVCEPRLTLEAVQEAALPFRGEVAQMPPAYSAKKINGKPAYKLARAGEAVELKPKVIEIHSFTIDGLEGDTAAFTMRVSAGGYVRSVAHELGQTLGFGAHLSSLRRTQAGVFTLAEAWRLEQVEAMRGELERVMVHPRAMLPEMPAVTADAGTLGKLRNGMQANLAEFSDAPLVRVFAGQRELVAVAKRVAGTLFQPLMVLG